MAIAPTANAPSITEPTARVPSAPAPDAIAPTFASFASSGLELEPRLFFDGRNIGCFLLRQDWPARSPYSQS